MNGANTASHCQFSHVLGQYGRHLRDRNVIANATFAWTKDTGITFGWTPLRRARTRGKRS